MTRVLKWAFGILGGIVILGAITSYTPDNTQMLTDTPDQAAMDEKKPISNMGVFDCLTNSGGVIMPDSDHLYSLNKMTVFQSIPDGVLMRAAQSVDERLNALEEIAFLKTDRDFADGAMLNGYLAAYRGTYEYITKDDNQKNVLAFKLVNKTFQDRRK